MVKEFKDTRYIASLTGGIGSILVLLGGMEHGLMKYITHPEVVKAAAGQRTKRANYLDRHYIKPGAAGAFIECDLCSTQGPLMSPAMWRDFGFPHLKSRIDNLKSLEKDLQIIFHSCGNTRKLLDMFIDAGVQVYQSIQSIPQMWIGDLKREYGDSLVLWGGVPVEELVQGTPQSIRVAVRKAMESTAQDGGLILGPSHSIAYGTQYENFMAMLDEFDRLRFKF